MNGKVYRTQHNTPLGSTSGTSWLDTTNSYTGVTYCTWSSGISHDREDHRYVVTATFASGTSRTTVAAPVAQCL